MNVKYRSFINKCGEPIQAISNDAARKLSKGQNMRRRYKDCKVSVAESRIVDAPGAKPILQSVHVWSLRFDTEGKLVKRTLKRFSESALASDTVTEPKTSDILASYVHETFNLEQTENESGSSDTLYSQLWTLAAA